MKKNQGQRPQNGIGKEHSRGTIGTNSKIITTGREDMDKEANANYEGSSKYKREGAA